MQLCGQATKCTRDLHAIASTFRKAYIFRSTNQPILGHFQCLLELIANELRQLGQILVKGRPFKLLSVACGPANEISDIFSDAGDFAKYHITLLDQDSNAITEATNNIAEAEKRYNIKATVRYQHSSIGVFLKPNKVLDSLGKFDFIYSMGLYDYLDDKTAGMLSKSLYDLLEPDGTLLLGNYTTLSTQNLICMEYLCDWRLVYRSPQEFVKLLSTSCSQDVVVGLEPSGTQMFLRAKKSLDNDAQALPVVNARL